MSDSETPASVFYAYFEDVAKLRAAARTNSWKVLDYVDTNSISVQTTRKFATKDAAIAWVQEQVNELKTVFGCGEVVEIEEIDFPNRCRYCTCNGQKPIRSYIVTDIGIESDNPLADDCHKHGA